MLLGGALLTAGLGLMGTLDETTSLVLLSVFMLMLGAGVGMLTNTPTGRAWGRSS